MIACSPIRTCARYVPRPGWSRRRVMPQSPSGTCCFHLSLGCGKPNYVATSNSCQSLIGPDVAKRRSNWQLLAVKSVVSRRGPQKTRVNISIGSHNMNLRLLFPKQGIISRMKWSLIPMSWMQGCASAGLVLGLSVCSSTSEPAYSEAKPSKEDSSTANLSHGKQVYTDYSVIGIPGDGRCLFRAVAHGACIRSGKPAPSESLQRELADELRAEVADEFVKRREETEWFIEGDFDTYVSQIRKTHVWGGEPELLMASHVLKMPITVYMNDQDSGGLISIAEYGQEYSKEDPIRVLYHGFGHYDALHIPAKKDSRSRL